MPILARKLLISAATDGIIIQPVAQRNQRVGAATKISYRYHVVSTTLGTGEEYNGSTIVLEAHGIVGLLTVSSTSFLISIISHQQVAQIEGKSVFVIKDVAIIPLASQVVATDAIRSARDAIRKQKTEPEQDSEASEGSDDDKDQFVDEDEIPDEPNGSLHSQDAVEQGLSRTHKRTSSVVEDVINKKGVYGRFAERWFSRRGWSVGNRRLQGMSTAEDSKTNRLTFAPEDSPSFEKAKLEDPGAVSEYGIRQAQIRDQGNQAKQAVAPQTHIDGEHDVTISLLPKLLRTAKLFLQSQSFFYSYELDITRRFSEERLSTDTQLYQRVDPLFFWNHHLISPFIDGRQLPLILPIMQGFVGQRTFTVASEPEKGKSGLPTSDPCAGEVVERQSKEELNINTENHDLTLTLISRRSVKRAGLRYLRRGVDDEGHVANFVESEQVLSSQNWSPLQPTYSFVQIRGSIPLYFSQSPYSFKPVPILQHSPETNQLAFRKHFSTLLNRYGGILVDSLVEKHGNEALVGKEYDTQVRKFNESGGIKGQKIGFEWFDFHAVCRGMKFENVDQLMDLLDHELDEFGYTVIKSGQIYTKQKGVLRTNCMDCLDRTNVVQSACARKALKKQLQQEGIDLDIQISQNARCFNTLWADNGDAISRQYASTAALKGDFTRTSKRNYRGALNDFGLTLSRYFNNIVNDYFGQATIDYLLGNVTEQVFEEFEADMMNADPAMSMRRIRQNAIDLSAKIVIADVSEELIAGWTLLCPQRENTLRSLPFEESVLLLTTTALYICRFDWNTEKVSSFKRVDLRHITKIYYGTYITSTLGAAHVDEKRNVGFVVVFEPGKEDIARVNTRSLKSTYSERDDDKEWSEDDVVDPLSADQKNSSAGQQRGKSKDIQSSVTRFLAFKAAPARTSFANMEGQETSVISEQDLIRGICEEIERVAMAKDRTAEIEANQRIVEQNDVISLAEAKKSTGLLEQWGYSLKKLVWA